MLKQACKRNMQFINGALTIESLANGQFMP